MARLARLQELYEENLRVEEKIELNNQIFEQERVVANLREQLENTDNRIEYITVSISLNEEASSFANISILSLGDWIKNFMNSVNFILRAFAWLLPFGILYIAYKLIRRKKK